MSNNDFEKAVAAKLTTDTESPAANDAPETTPVEPGTPGTPDAATPEAEAKPADQPAELLAGKYESAEELERAYEELRTKFNERDAEIGELRGLREEFETLRGRMDAPKHDYDTLIDEDPASATQLAYQSGDAYHLQAALAAWKEQDPFGAAVWYSGVRSQAEIAAITTHYESRLSIHDASAQQTELAGAMAAFAQANPDLEEIAPAMVAIAEESPQIMALMQSPDPKAKLEVFDFLATKARARLGVVPPAPAPAAIDDETAATKKAGALLSGGGGAAVRALPDEDTTDAAVELKQTFREHFGLTPLT